jgi:hypothetical protein
MGLFAAIPANPFIFLSADALGSKEDVKSWKECAHIQNTDTVAKDIPSLRSGLEKQYLVQQRLFDDKNQSQAEFVSSVPNP